MTAPRSSDIDTLVLGAGVLGLACAADRARAGERVVVLDPGGPNASSVAAGMIAPAMESLIDGAHAQRAALLRAARDLWPAFAARHGLALDRAGAVWRGDDAEVVRDRLSALGFDARLTPQGLFTPDDWRIDCEPALAALAHAPGLIRMVGRARAIRSRQDRWAVETDAGEHRAARVIVASGWAAAAIAGPPELDAITRIVRPVRGQIGRFVDVAASTTLRCADGYATPGAGGLLAGATMEPGRDDLFPDPHCARAQAALAARLTGADGGPGEARVGVRGATPDGLPLAGEVLPGLAVALAPRRNGWLMAPLVAAVVSAALAGRAAPVGAEALAPQRFGHRTSAHPREGGDPEIS